MAELKPCDCKSEPNIVRVWSGSDKFCVRCSCGISTKLYDTIQQAIDAWNRKEK